MPVLRVNGHGVEIAAAPLPPLRIRQPQPIQHIGRPHRAAFISGHSAHAQPRQGIKKSGDHFLRVTEDLPPQGGEGRPVSRAVLADDILSHASTWR